MKTYQHKQRPTEQVKHFFETYLAQPSVRTGDRIPSIKEISDRLDVSQSTVRNELRRLLHDGRLQSRRGSGTFVSDKHPTNHAVSVRIGVNMRNFSDFRRPTANWGTIIYHDVTDAVMKLGSSASITSLFSASEDIDSLPLKEIKRRCSDLNGLILLPGGAHAKSILEHCNNTNKPCVFLNPPLANSTSNFVTPDRYTAACNLARAFSTSGRRRMAVMIHSPPEDSASVQQFLAGVMNGTWNTIGRELDIRVVYCNGQAHQDGHKALLKLWQQEHFYPDCIISTSDGLGSGAFEALREIGVRVPEQCSVVAGAGHNIKTDTLHLTTLVHSLAKASTTLVDMLVDMINRDTLEMPGKIMPTDILPRQSTREEENQLLIQYFASASDSTITG